MPDPSPSLPPVPADVPLSDAELATLRTNLEPAARTLGGALSPQAAGMLLRVVAEVERCRTRDGGMR